MNARKNEIVRLAIRDVGKNGEGIGSADGLTVFVRDAVVGDEVEAKLTKVKKHYAYARLLRVITPSPERVSPRCPVAGPCGGCQLQHLDYAAQLRLKERVVENALARIGGFAVIDAEAGAHAQGASQGEKHEAGTEERNARQGMTGAVVRVEHILGMEDPWKYRNKAQYPVGTGGAGYYAVHSHRIVPLPEDGCAIGMPHDKPLLAAVLGWMRAHNIPAYDEETHTGLVRHVLIRTGAATGEVMLCLVINGDEVPHAQDLIYAINAEGICFQDAEARDETSDADNGSTATDGIQVRELRLVGITYSVNKERTNVILGGPAQLLWGQPYITDRIGDVSFRISPESFYQVNPRQTEKLYATALDFAQLTGEETVWDLYCGIGTISLFLAQKVKRVIGVEIVERAVKDARENAALNHITNAEFHAGRAEDIARALYQEGRNDAQGASGDADCRADVVVVDPPRKGCDPQLLSCMIEMAPQRIVYVSCDPATLARDLRILADGGYTIERVQPVDMFPHSMHVETVCLLSKLSEAKNHISVKVDMDEMDVTAAESKATYQEIQEWAQEKYGFHVSHLNIAKTKRKCGIIERQNYNLPKSEDSRSPETPKEKEEAIIEAFKAFQMI